MFVCSIVLLFLIKSLHDFLIFLTQIRALAIYRTIYCNNDISWISISSYPAKNNDFSGRITLYFRTFVPSVAVKSCRVTFQLICRLVFYLYYMVILNNLLVVKEDHIFSGTTSTAAFALCSTYSQTDVCIVLWNLFMPRDPTITKSGLCSAMSSQIPSPGFPLWKRLW